MTTTSSVRRWAPPACLAVELVGALAPWSASGDTERNSFALVSVARRFGLLEGWERVLGGAWYFLPLAVVLCVLATLLRRPYLAAGVAAAAAAAGMVLVSVAGRLPFADRPGRDVTLWASIAAVVAVAVSTGGREGGGGRRTRRNGR